MKVWDRVCCRWVKWQGSRAAWKALPHAKAAVVACVLCGGAVAVLASPRHQTTYSMPPTRPEGHIVFSAPLPPAPGGGWGYAEPLPGGYPGPAFGGFYSPPSGTFLPGPGSLTVAYEAPCPPPDHTGHHGPPPPRGVPEPSTLAILGAAVLALRFLSKGLS